MRQTLRARGGGVEHGVGVGRLDHGRDVGDPTTTAATTARGTTAETLAAQSTSTVATAQVTFISAPALASARRTRSNLAALTTEVQHDVDDDGPSSTTAITRLESPLSLRKLGMFVLK